MVVKCYLTDTLNVMDRCTGISKERSKQEQLGDGMDASGTCRLPWQGLGTQEMDLIWSTYWANEY